MSAFKTNQLCDLGPVPIPRWCFCPAPLSSTCPSTAAVIASIPGESDGAATDQHGPREKVKRKPGLNSPPALMTSKELDDLQWMLGTGRYGQ